MNDATASSTESRLRSFERVRLDAADCRDCPLWEGNTQTVFGLGPVDAAVIFIGEAPGAQEDLAGIPFVGSAGQMFDEGIAEAGIDRASVYVTNTVKHRPFVENNGRRRNRTPKQSEIKACATWLDRELEIVRPQIVCCLGAVAAKRILGKQFGLMKQRGQWLSTETIPHVLATVHPSFVMIQRHNARQEWFQTFVDDLRLVREKITELRLS
jgi:DNA polymerase